MLNNFSSSIHDTESIKKAQDIALLKYFRNE